MSDKPATLSSEERDRRVLELWERVVEVEGRLIPTGLHVFGRASDEQECADLLRMVASFDRPECGARALTDLVAEGLGLGTYDSLVGDKSEDGWRRRERVDKIVRRSVEIFLREGSERAARLLEAEARVSAEESGRVFALLSKIREQ
ncbi:MAG: hypothetical protein DMF66_06110, partial [Acidobacteria bacterium]